MTSSERRMAAGEAVRRRGEELRAEVELQARRDPSRLPPLLTGLEAEVQRTPALRPWVEWAEGFTAQLTGRPAIAEPLLASAASTFRRAGDRHTAARVDLALMDALACLGRHRAAAACGRRALATFTEFGDRPRAASALLNLGGLADARDQVREALTLWRRARRLLPAESRLRRGLVEHSLAAAMQALGSFRLASRLYTRAIELEEAAGATGSALQPRLGLAEVQALLGEVGQALEQLQNVEVEATRLDDDNLLFESRLLRCRLELDLGHPRRANELAATTQPRCLASGRLDDAARFAVLRALAVADGADGDLEATVVEAEKALEVAGLAVAGAAMRAALARRGRPQPSRQLRRDAARLQEAGLVVSADLALLAAAAALAAEHRPREARRLCHEVLARRQASVWPRLEALSLLAELEAPTDPGAAVRHLRQAVASLESLRGRLRSEPDRTAFATRTSAVYGRLVELLLKRGGGRAHREAFELVSRVKSRSLLEALDRRHDLEWKESPELVQRWARLRNELAAALAAHEGARGERSRYAGRISGRIGRLARAVEELELEVGRAQPGLGLVLGRPPAVELARLLEPGEVYLELFFTGADLVVFTLADSRLGVTVKRGAREQAEARVDALRFHLSKAAYGRRHLEAAGAFLVGQARSRLAELGELLLAGLAGRRPVTRLYVAPHGALHHLPFAALELEGEPILSRCPVAVVPGSGVLAHLLRRPHRPPRSLAIAGAAHTALPEIEHEVAELGRRFPAARVEGSATVATVCELLSHSDAVHVASHGAFQPLFPAGSGIRLADGWLTALDLLRLPLAARFVSLGSCASGELAVTPGEELGGVVRALVANGVQSAVVAPGAVDDQLGRQTALMLYDRLGALGPGEALRHALLTLRGDHPHPALWAGVQLYGNPRPWEDSR